MTGWATDQLKPADEPVRFRRNPPLRVRDKPTARPTMKTYALFFAIVTLALAYVASQALNAGAAALLLR